MSELRDIQGHQRVAALLLSLEPQERATLLKKLSPDVVERVAESMIELDARLSGAGVADELKENLARDLHGQQTIHGCGTDTLGATLKASLGKNAGDRLFQSILVRRKETRPFLEIESHDPFEIGLILREEAPTVAALVLSYLEPGMTANILKTFDHEQAVDTLRRMVGIEPPKPEILKSIAAELLEALRNAPQIIGDVDPSERIKNVANVLNQSAPEMERGVIERLSEQDDKMAQELREFMFTWDDVATIDKRTMQKILGMVDTKTLSVALKGCAQEVESNILGNLSSRVADMVAEERELAGPMPMNEVTQARSDILKNIRAMIEAGEYRPSRGGEELVA